ncbi:helix-turn-helix domain-containing protein [Lysobacter capsici]|uniref:helix-turn-helix domain-containing protein n=1 Tax=Lysobacter capsici TaxID=435897 RepID=UPI001C007E5F|nr:helix-turn-helix transcriptional regulator [Lysobacter capsici]QWF18143.1 helix-turn-helix domain-containing protein [Lysobacter capsici]
MPRGPAPPAPGVVALRLRQAREAVGLSQRGLGIAAGLDPTVASPRINQYESGKHTPDIRTLEMLGKVLGKPVPFFYAADDVLAEAIDLLAQMSAQARKAAIKTLRESMDRR